MNTSLRILALPLLAALFIGACSDEPTSNQDCPDRDTLSLTVRATGPCVTGFQVIVDTLDNTPPDTMLTIGPGGATVNQTLRLYRRRANPTGCVYRQPIVSVRSPQGALIRRETMQNYAVWDLDC